MPGRVGSVLTYLRRLGTTPGPDSDRVLLDRFATQRDEAAFATILERHGPMVRGVCERLLRDAHDADDAFQATFLVLARKATAVSWQESIAGWLHEVASRVARKARVRPCLVAQTQGESAVSDADPASHAAQRELREVLDEELARLPLKYRLPLVLCYLEGRSNEEAARQLGWTKGTVSGRLSRARDLLRPRLLRRGLGVAALGAGLPVVPAVSVAAPVLQATLKAAPLYLARSASVAGVASARALALAQGALQAMFVHRLKVGAVFVLVLLLGVSAVVGFRALAGERGEPRKVVASPAPEKPPKKAETDLEKLQGVWRLVALEADGKPATKEELEKWGFRKLVIEGEWFSEVDGDFGPSWKIKIDPAKTPRTIDWFRNERVVMGGVERETDTLVDVGVYELDGDKLKIARAYDTGPAGRPAGFKTKPDASFVVRVYERGEPPEPAKEKRPEFVKAQVTLYLGRDGVEEPEQVLKATIKDKATIAKFVDCFPGMATGKKNVVAGGWLPRLEVNFEGRKGEKARVLSIWTNWNEGGGDWKVKGNLMKHAGELFGVQRLIDQGSLMEPWQVVSFEQGGKKRAVKDGTLTANDHQFNIAVEGKTEFAATEYSVDPARKPGAIDFTVRDGGRRKEVRGIYLLKGDTLTICVDRGGGPRPAAFETRVDDAGQVLWVLRTKRE